MGLFRVLAVAGIVFTVFTGVCNAAVVERFHLGGWSGAAYTDAGSGRLSTCVAAARYKSGVTLYVQVDTTYRWAIGFSAPGWNMKAGDRIPLRYRIDRGDWQQGTATATAKDLARMPMPPEGYIITRFRRGRSLYVHDGVKAYEFRLTGTSRLMARMAECIKQNTARYGAAPGMGSASADAPSARLGASRDAQPAAPSVPPIDPKLAVEATQALFNFMGSAGLSGLKLLPDEQRPDNFKGLHAVAGGDARTVVAHIFVPGSYTDESELMSLIVADSRKNCDGSFTSGTERTTAGGKTLLTSLCDCETGNHELIERVAIVTRKAGGVYVYGVTDTHAGKGGGAPISPPELTDPDLNAAAASAAE